MGYTADMLHHRFIDQSRKQAEKIAIRDKATGNDLTYSRALVASLILARRFRKLERGRIGIMLPTSAGGALAVAASLLAGLTPVMNQLLHGCCEKLSLRPAAMRFQSHRHRPCIAGEDRL